MDNLIFYLAKMALVLAFLATTPTRGRKEDECLKLHALVISLFTLFLR